MAKLKIYGYKKCSTCRKALKFLDSKGIEYSEIDIIEKAPSATELRRALAAYNGELKKLFNTSGVAYREMKMSDQLKTMSESEAIKVLAGNGRLVKRPFVATSDVQLVGFKEAEWDSAL